MPGPGCRFGFYTFQSFFESLQSTGVSESGLEKVRAFIARQEEHHQKKTFTQEYDEFMAAHGFKNNSNDSG